MEAIAKRTFRFFFAIVGNGGAIYATVVPLGETKGLG